MTTSPVPPKSKPKTVVGAIILLARSFASVAHQLRRVADVGERFALHHGLPELSTEVEVLGSAIPSTGPRSDREIAQEEVWSNHEKVADVLG
jgi:hypothetical protein